MPHLYTSHAGEPIAQCAAQLMLAQCVGERLAEAVVLVPTRRACVTMREAFSQVLEGRASLLPRMIPLADLDAGLLSLLGPHALDVLKEIPPAMHESERRFLLARQVMAFERRRFTGVHMVSVDYALALADTLLALQDQCTRAGVALSQESLRPLMARDVADHWKQALQFLAILTDAWPEMERERGVITAPAREVAVLTRLAEHWKIHPPTQPIYMVGSTASQPATAALMRVIADSANGHVVLPGLDTSMREDEWTRVAAGHPLFHLKQFLDGWPVAPSAVISLTQNTRSVWMEAFGAMEEWSSSADFEKQSSLPRLIPCAHAEEEARVIAVLMREALQEKNTRVALITPDEGLMARVASHLRRDGITADRLSAGTLAHTETGSVWTALTQALAEPHRPLLLRALLHHPLLAFDAVLLDGFEAGWRGVMRAGDGVMPRHDPALKSHADYARAKNLLHNLKDLSEFSTDAPGWLTRARAVLEAAKTQRGQGAEAVEEALEALRYAEDFGRLDAVDFAALVADQLRAPWRGAGLDADPRIAMLTPVEARLEHFDRVILASMTDDVWPGRTAPNPWLNLAMQAALGLPSPAEHVSLLAHDVLMLGSAREVFLTYPRRAEGAPATRSRFIERLVTRLVAAGGDEAQLLAPRYIEWANARDASVEYEPETPVYPRPSAEQRPRRLPVTDIDKLFRDPFAIYAKHVLGLRKLDEIDAEAEASHFGNLTHKAIHALTLHWNETGRAASADELETIATRALADFAGNPSIDLFWRARLMNGLRFVNGLEATRRTALTHVEPELPVEGALADITLHGRIDRMEEGASGRTIIDYKTGDAPTRREILDGRALQLLVYGMVLTQASGAAAKSPPPEGEGRGGSFDLATPRPNSAPLPTSPLRGEELLPAIEYWQLPRIGEEGDITRLESSELNLAEIEAKLHAALTQMLDATTPFLATRDNERFASDYDGISRWDEWA